MKIELTTDWILNNLTTSNYSVNGDVLITCDGENYHWIILALNTLNIEYTNDELFDEYDVEFEYPEYFFSFNLEDIKDKSPIFYKNMYELNERNSNIINDDLDDLYENYIPTNRKILTFHECEQYYKQISEDNFKILVCHLCKNELASKIDGFSYYNNILYFKIDDEFVSVKNK